MKLNSSLLIALLSLLIIIVIGWNFFVFRERYIFDLKLGSNRAVIDKDLFNNRGDENQENDFKNDKKEDENNREIEEDNSIKLLFFGDMMLDRHVGEKINKYGLDYLLSKINEGDFNSSYDIISANLEGAVTDNGGHYKPDNAYDFAFNPKLIQELKNYNFNFFNLANNHLSDQGRIGVEETYKNLSNLGFYYSGCQDAYLSINTTSPEIILGGSMPILDYNNCSDIVLNIKNKKIAFLGISLVYNNIAEVDILDRIIKLKESSDVVIVNIHFGNEYQGQANNRQEVLARKMVDSGADIIIGHHPHVIQNYEIYKERPIFYSLGNFIFDQYFSAETQEGLAIKIILSDEKEGTKIASEVYKIKTKGSKIEEISKMP